MTKQDCIEVILQTNKWFDKKVQQLNLIIDKENPQKIFFQGKDGEQIELPEDYKKGFYVGIQTALEVLGEFPVKIEKTK